MNGIHGEVLMWALGTDSTKRPFLTLLLQEEEKEEENTSEEGGRADISEPVKTFTSPMLETRLGLKSPDPIGKLPNRHVLPFSPLVRNENKDKPKLMQK